MPFYDHHASKIKKYWILMLPPKKIRRLLLKIFFMKKKSMMLQQVTATAFYGLSFVSATYYGTSAKISKRSTDFDKTQYSTLEDSYPSWRCNWGEKSEKFLRIKPTIQSKTLQVSQGMKTFIF